MTQLRAAGGIAALALLALSAACSDNAPVGPDPADNVLRILFASRPFEEQTIAVNGTLQLNAQILDSSGDAVRASAIDWRTTDATVASVTSVGLVTGRSVGTTLVIASADGHADTARVNVALPVSEALACADGEEGLSLQPGQVFTTTGDRATSLCVQTGSEDGEYALVAFNASQEAGATMAVALTGAGVSRTVAGPPTPDRIPGGSVAAPVLRRDDAFHMRLLESSQRALEPRLQTASRRGLVPTAPRFAQVPASGDLLRLNVEVDSGDGCQNPDLRTGRVAAVTDRAIVVVDTANPKTGLSTSGEADLYRSFGIAFDTLVWRVDTGNFGEPSDIDGNGHVIIFFTRAVNEQTPESNDDSYVGGYFYNRDLFQKTGANACPGSNVAEMFYMLAPDPSGAVNGHPRTIPFIRNSTVGILAHEFQHLINDSRRLYVNNAPVWETSWMNEGLSHIAEELTFYETSGLHPRQNLDAGFFSQQAARDAFNQFQGSNVERLIRFLQNPETSTLMGTDNLANRGAVWSFLRYAADRDVGSDTTLWNRLVKDTNSQGLDNLRNALGVDPREWIQDWATSIYTDDAGLALPNPERFTQPSWNFRALLPAATVNGTAFGRYPLKTFTLGTTSATSFTLSGGGAVYVRFRAPAGQRAAVRATVGDLPATSLLKITVVRTR
jgi:hypothetical protein